MGIHRVYAIVVKLPSRLNRRSFIRDLKAFLSDYETIVGYFKHNDCLMAVLNDINDFKTIYNILRYRGYEAKKIDEMFVTDECYERLKNDKSRERRFMCWLRNLFPLW